MAPVQTAHSGKGQQGLVLRATNEPSCHPLTPSSVPIPEFQPRAGKSWMSFHIPIPAREQCMATAPRFAIGLWLPLRVSSKLVCQNRGTPKNAFGCPSKLLKKGILTPASLALASKRDEVERCGPDVSAGCWCTCQMPNAKRESRGGLSK